VVNIISPGETGFHLVKHPSVKNCIQVRLSGQVDVKAISGTDKKLTLELEEKQRCLRCAQLPAIKA
jgi:hypothetical protein